MYRKVRKVLSLIKHYKKFISAESYYKNSERKSKIEIFLDQLYFIIKYGDYERFYFLYGFDVKGMSIKKITSKYIIPYNKFQAKIDALNLENPIYGNRHGRTLTADKFYFNIFLNAFSIPTPKVFCFIKNEKFIYLDDNFVVNSEMSEKDKIKSFFLNDMDAFAKPFAGQLGQGIFSLKIENKNIYINNKQTDFDELMKIVSSADYLIQERITQHPKINALCSSTLNTIRLQTVMTESNKIVPFGAILRVGREGSFVDNWASGGVAVGIDMQNGKLLENGYLKPMYGTITNKHQDSNIVFKDYEIPFFKEALEHAVFLHERMYRCHSVGWDIAITKDGPVFIEGNGLWEISLIQAACGGMKEIEKHFNIQS